MRISGKARDLVRREHGHIASKLGQACRRDIEGMRQTQPRAGQSQANVDDRIVQNLRESFDALSKLYLDAYEREAVDLAIEDVEEITGQMKSQVRAVLQSRIELEPRSVGIDFHERLEALVHEQRGKLVLGMKRMEYDRATPRSTPVEPRNVYNISGPNARVNINSTDSSVNVVTVAPEDLFASIRSLIEELPADRREEVTNAVDELEAAQGTPAFLQKYQHFVGVLADHLQIFQAFLPALTQFFS